jgi:hypothetical protein
MMIPPTPKAAITSRTANKMSNGFDVAGSVAGAFVSAALAGTAADASDTACGSATPYALP